LSTGKHDHDAVLVTGKVVNKGMFVNFFFWKFCINRWMMLLIETIEVVCVCVVECGEANPEHLYE
jgi:hypothetical protein